jgi:hypothetical protein
MKPRTVTLIVLFIVGEAVGLALGEAFFRLFLKAAPPMALSQFNSQASHVVHLAYGAGVGLVLFVWALLGMAAGSLLRSGSKPAAGS